MDFEQKFNDAMSRIDLLLNNDYTPKNIKKYIEGYKLEQSIDERNKRRIEESFLNQSNSNSYIFNDKRKKQVTLTEIKEHEVKFDRMKGKNIINNELKKKKLKEQENEYILKMEREYNTKKYYPIDSENFNKNKLENNLKKREFSRLVNKINIEKLKERNKKRRLELDMNNINHASNIELKNKRMNSKSEITQKDKINIKKMILSDSNIQSRNRSVKLRRVKPIKTFEKEKENRYNIDIRTPLEVRPDYLHQKDKLFPNRKKIYKKEINSNSKDKYYNHLNELQYKADDYDIQAKRETQLLKLRNKYDTEGANKVSNLLYDSISTKFALLNQIQRDINSTNRKQFK